MPLVFLSHKHEEKTVVLTIENQLKLHLLDTWLDKNNLPGVSPIWSEITSGVKRCKYFVPFLSRLYCSSNPCLQELQQAYAKSIQKELFIIPVIIGNKDELLGCLSNSDARSIIEMLFISKYCIFLDPYNITKTADEIADAISREEGIRFSPVTTESIDGHPFHVIEFSVDRRKYTEGILPEGFLSQWDFNVTRFIAEKDDDNVLRKGIPILLAGRGPNWMYSFMTVPFFNNRSIYVYNNQTDDCICVHCLKGDKVHFVGRTLKRK